MTEGKRYNIHGDLTEEGDFYFSSRAERWVPHVGIVLPDLLDLMWFFHDSMATPKRTWIDNIFRRHPLTLNPKSPHNHHWQRSRGMTEEEVAIARRNNWSKTSEVANLLCLNCYRGRAHHVGTKCLFGPHHFKESTNL